MSCNFDRVLDRRGTDSLKWDSCGEVFGKDDLLPMWVADSDWPAPQAVVEALKKRIEHGVFGYTRPGKEMDNIVVDWVKRRYNWTIKPEWITYTSGVVPAVNVAIKALTRPGDEVILQSPVYYPFFDAIKNNGAQILNNQLLFNGSKYQIDFNDLEEKLADDPVMKRESRAKILLFCSPHNPVGRVWSKEELQHLAELCLGKEIVIISDEIHADLIFPGNKHIPVASLSEDIAANTMTMIAPSKTFNLAGLHTSVVIIPDSSLRRSFEEARTGLVGRGNVLGFEAMKAAYSSCDDWLEDQMVYLEESLKYTISFINNNLSGIKVVEPEGTYLLWLDFRDLGMDPAELNNFMINRARIALDAGTWFGPGGEGFMRLNLACPRSLLKDGLHRIKRALTDTR